MTDRKTWPKLTACAAALACLAAAPARADFYQQTNLVSNGFVPAATVDPALQSPWGIAFSPTGPFWVSDNNDSLSTLYTGAGTKLGLTVSVGSPTGQVFNSDAAGFSLANGKAASFIFAGSDGTVSAWNGGSGTTAQVVYTGPSGASYNGLTEGTVGGQTYLYAADTGTGRIAVLNSSFAPVSLPGGFVDPSLPAGFLPFNAQVLNGHLFVAYANFGLTKAGVVAEFDLDGNFIRQVAAGGTLNQPWGLDIAPAHFGRYSNDLLVGNLADGTINAFDPTTDAFLGQLDGAGGAPIADPGLWMLVNGNGGAAGAANTVYFSSEGPSGVDGVLGGISDVPEPGAAALALAGLTGLALVRRRAVG